MTKAEIVGLLACLALGAGSFLLLGSYPPTLVAVVAAAAILANALTRWIRGTSTNQDG